MLISRANKIPSKERIISKTAHLSLFSAFATRARVLYPFDEGRAQANIYPLAPSTGTLALLGPVCNWHYCVRFLFVCRLGIRSHFQIRNASDRRGILGLSDWSLFPFVYTKMAVAIAHTLHTRCLSLSAISSRWNLFFSTVEIPWFHVDIVHFRYVFHSPPISEKTHQSNKVNNQSLVFVQRCWSTLNFRMTVETDTIKNSKESPSKIKRKRASRSSSSGSSSSGSTSSSSASSRSSSSSSSNSSSSSSRSSSAASSPEKKNARGSAKTGNNATKSSNKKPSDHASTDDKQNAVSTSNQTRRSPSPSRRQEKEKEKEATKIYIGKLSLNVNKEHLAEIFGTFGEIKEIELPSHRIHPHLHRTYAHIDYVAPAGAEQACKYMEGGQIDGLEIVCALVHGQPPHLSGERNRRETSPYRRRRRSPLPPSRHFPPPRRGGDRDRDRGRYNDRRPPYSPPSRNYRRGPSSPVSNRRTGASGNAAESPKKKERRYSRSSSSESK